jgi:predicted Zn-dependent protease
MGRLLNIILRNSCTVLALAAGLSGCATNPVTGDKDFVLLSESEEISLGRRYHQDILREMSVYQDPDLAAYVSRVGQRVASASHRPGLNYQFTVIDSSDVNAFALPGGYIYITRGLLAYLNSEAELAAVLGHEIGHVTARHAVRQHSASTAAGVAGAILQATTGVQGSQDLFNVFGKAILSGYGREHELESDRLGAQYLARTGYDPQAMLKVIGVLKNQELFERQRAREENREPRAYHGVFASHPDNDRRLQEVVSEANRLRNGSGTRIGREDYLSEIDGLRFGDS